MAEIKAYIYNGDLVKMCFKKAREDISPEEYIEYCLEQWRNSIQIRYDNCVALGKSPFSIRCARKNLDWIEGLSQKWQEGEDDIRFEIWKDEYHFVRNNP